MKPLKLTTIESYPSVEKIKQWLSTRSRDDNCIWVKPLVEELYALIPTTPEMDQILSAFYQHPTQRIGVQEGRKLSLQVHRLARVESNLAIQFTYRAIGHAIATIHSHRHTYGAILYGVKAIHQMGYSARQIEEFCHRYEKKVGQNA